MNKLSRKQIIGGALIIGLVIAGYFIVTRNKGATLPNTTTIKRGDVVQEVSVTGRVEPVTTVSLGFEKSGRIQSVSTVVGSHVAEGARLAAIESSTEEANLLEARARLDELKRGSRPEELTVKEAELAKDTQDLDNVYDGVLDTVNDAFTKTDDALHPKMAGVFSGSKASSYRFTYSICDTALETNGTWLRYTTEADLDLWRTELRAVSPASSRDELSKILTGASGHLETIKAFLETVNRTLTLDCTISSSALDTYRTNVNTARTNITTATAAINTKKQSIASLTLTVAKVQNELALLKAGTASEVIAAQEARVLAAEGELAKHHINAPVAGTVTKVDAKVGEYATAAAPLISIISDTAFKIEANVPESDIAKVATGDIAHITLDAYGSDVVFEGRVTMIDPAETIIDNVPTYKVTLHFSQNDPRIKSGMTANIDIATARAQNVLYVPQRAIVTRDSKKFLMVVGENNTTSEVPVMTGLRGSDGSIEVTSGAIEGMAIMIAPK